MPSHVPLCLMIHDTGFSAATTSTTSITTITTTRRPTTMAVNVAEEAVIIYLTGSFVWITLKKSRLCNFPIVRCSPGLNKALIDYCRSASLNVSRLFLAGFRGISIPLRVIAILAPPPRILPQLRKCSTFQAPLCPSLSPFSLSTFISSIFVVRC